MEKKYQVFISSTFLDLKDERQAVIRSILNLGHIPAGMELFPASSMDQLSYIKKVIDLCDYYVLILGGRYGSLDKDGISFTEKEYAYAIQRGIPVISMVHADTGELKSKHVDTDVAQIERLANFRAKVTESRLCKMWQSIAELEAGVVIALTTAFSDTPKTGWRRDDEELSNEALRKINDLTRRYDYYRGKCDETVQKLSSYENLAKTEINIRYTWDDQPSRFLASGNDIIREFAARLNAGLSTKEIDEGLATMVRHGHELSHGNVDIHRSSVEAIRLFFQVFEIADEDAAGHLFILENKKYLLKAAFIPLNSVIHDNEIPF